MKFFLAFFAYLLLAFLLIKGVVGLAHGKPWLLISAFAVYLAGLVWFGCFPKKAH